jgi:carbon monoxide dehydrogenase subunit G
MEMAGERRIAATPQRVWEALNDPEVLRLCIPGCQSLVKEADDRFSAIAQIKIGPIGARFKGAVTLTDLDPPNGYTISGQAAWRAMRRAWRKSGSATMAPAHCWPMMSMPRLAGAWRNWVGR